MQPWDIAMQQRTTDFADAILDLVDDLPSTCSATIIVNQIGRSATSAMANHAESARPRTIADKRAKQGICLQELQATRGWLVLLYRRGLLSKASADRLISETDALIGLFVASIRQFRNR